CTAPASSVIYTLSLHDALPILLWLAGRRPVGLTFDVNRDQQTLGLLYCWWRYRQEEKKPLELTAQAPFHILAGKSAMAADTARPDRKSTRLNSSHVKISYAVFC